jgi:hypothetical protein
MHRPVASSGLAAEPGLLLDKQDKGADDDSGRDRQTLFFRDRSLADDKAANRIEKGGNDDKEEEADVPPTREHAGDQEEKILRPESEDSIDRVEDQKKMRKAMELRCISQKRGRLEI